MRQAALVAVLAGCAIEPSVDTCDCPARMLASIEEAKDYWSQRGYTMPDIEAGFGPTQGYLFLAWTCTVRLDGPTTWCVVLDQDRNWFWVQEQDCPGQAWEVGTVLRRAIGVTVGAQQDAREPAACEVRH